MPEWLPATTASVAEARTHKGLTQRLLSPYCFPVPAKPSAVIDTRVIYCGDNLEQLKKLPPECVDLIYIDPPFNSNRNYEVFWGETKEKRRLENRRHLLR